MLEVMQRIGQAIASVAMREDADLNSISGEGIFHMPELAFAYACGKAIMARSSEIFGEAIPKWRREANLGNGGPTDLVFEYADGTRIAIEFKLRSSGLAYQQDIAKLLRLDPTTHCTAFCALVDTFTTQLPDDGRIGSVESYDKARVVSLLEPKPSFPSRQSWYTNDVCCVVGFWSVAPLLRK